MKKVLIVVALLGMSSSALATDISWRNGKKMVEIDCVARKGKLKEQCHERLYDLCDGAYAIKDVDQSIRIGGKSSARVEAQCTGKKGKNWSDWKKKNKNNWWN